MANDTDDDHDSIVVHDGPPGIASERESLTAGAAKSTASPAGSPPREPAKRATRTSSQKSSDGKWSDTLDPLRALPEVRSIPWYTGKELPTDKSIESTRVQTRGACLLASRGEVIDPPCSHCATGVGRFSQCIALPDWFHGACATCQLATRGNLCSLRGAITKDADTVKSESEQQESPAAEMPPTTIPSSRKEAESSTTPASRGRKPTANQSQSEPRQSAPTTSQPTQPLSSRPADEYISQFGQGSQTLKRKRESLQGTSVYRPYVSPYAPLDQPNRVASSLPNTPTISFAPNTIIPANIARDQSAYNNYVRTRENQQNAASRPPKLAPSVPTFSAVNGNGNRSSPATIQTGRNKTATRGRDDTESMSPSAQLLDRPLQSPTPDPPTPPTHITSSRPQPPTRMSTRTRNAQKKASANGSTAHRNTQSSPRDVSLIDTLPRRKQKQIYGIIGGLQSGIRSCQQQADNMQKQLDLLQSALGIDLEDDKEI